ncbi:MAG: hypothetical protein INR72_16420, partial [Williamsia herbipolensis]|nr:hypothetical protein [Williamsia herbipolensis]
MNGTTAQSTYTPTTSRVTPTADGDTSTGPQGLPQSSRVLANDRPGNAGVALDPSSLTLLTAGGVPAATVEIAGQGTYSVDRTDPAVPLVVFSPVPRFVGEATPVSYRVADANGTTARAIYTPTTVVVTPGARNDSTTGHQGAPQSVDPLANDLPGDAGVPFVPATLTLLDAAGRPSTAVTVDGQGTWRIDRTDPAVPRVEFTPLPTYAGTGDPVRYRVADANGTTTAADVTPTVTPVTRPDSSTGPQGLVQAAAVLANDTRTDGVTLVASSLTLVDAAGTATDNVTVPGQGTYTIDRRDPAAPRVVFTPVRTFIGTATPVVYQAADADGFVARDRYTPTTTGVTPRPRADTSTGAQGLAQSAAVLANDAPGDAGVPLDPPSLSLLTADRVPVTTVEIAGQGTYSIDRTDPTTPRVVFTPLPTFVGDATAVGYRIADVNGATADSTYTPTVTPVNPTARPDTSTGHQGARQSVRPLDNDLVGDAGVSFVPATLTLLDEAGRAVDAVVVDGQGRYSVDRTDPAAPRLVFAPLPAYSGTAAAARYRVADANGTRTSAIYTATVTPVLQADSSTGVQGQVQRIDPLANDTLDPAVVLVPASLTLVGADGLPTDTLTVPGEGSWTVDRTDPAAPVLVFTPLPTFTGTAAPVGYQVSDSDGNSLRSSVSAAVTSTGPQVRDDASSDLQGLAQSVDPLANDGPGDPRVALDPSSLTLLDATGQAVASITVPGQGTYRIVDGRIVFTPVAGFVGTPTAVVYRVADVNGTTATGRYQPAVTAVQPTAAPDTSTGVQGAHQFVDPLVNDRAGDSRIPLDPAALQLIGADGVGTSRLVVPGEGTYTVENGRLVFRPTATFTGTATPVTYRIADVNGTTTTSTYTPTVTPRPTEPTPP